MECKISYAVPGFPVWHRDFRDEICEYRNRHTNPLRNVTFYICIGAVHGLFDDDRCSQS
jgi:hypothetical protein